MFRLALLAALLLAPALSAQIVLSGTSYTQNFNGLGAGMPTGITCRSPITATDNGFSITPTLTPSPWPSAPGGWCNNAQPTG